MVWTKTRSIICQLRRNKPFLQETLPKAELFFMDHLLPELICRCKDLPLTWLKRSNVCTAKSQALAKWCSAQTAANTFIMHVWTLRDTPKNGNVDANGCIQRWWILDARQQHVRKNWCTPVYMHLTKSNWLHSFKKNTTHLTLQVLIYFFLNVHLHKISTDILFIPRKKYSLTVDNGNTQNLRARKKKNHFQVKMLEEFI